MEYFKEANFCVHSQICLIIMNRNIITGFSWRTQIIAAYDIENNMLYPINLFLPFFFIYITMNYINRFTPILKLTLPFIFCRKYFLLEIISREWIEKWKFQNKINLPLKQLTIQYHLFSEAWTAQIWEENGKRNKCTKIGRSKI